MYRTPILSYLYDGPSIQLIYNIHIKFIEKMTGEIFTFLNFMEHHKKFKQQC